MGVNAALCVSTRSLEFRERGRSKWCFLILTISLGLCLILGQDTRPSVVQWTIHDNTLFSQRCQIGTRYLQKLQLPHVSYANSDIHQLIKLEVKFFLQQSMNAQRGSKRLYVHPPWTSTLDGGRWSIPRPGRFNPRLITGTHCTECWVGAGWAPEPDWTTLVEENNPCLHRPITTPIGLAGPLLIHHHH